MKFALVSVFVYYNNRGWKQAKGPLGIDLYLGQNLAELLGP